MTEIKGIYNVNLGRVLPTSPQQIENPKQFISARLDVQLVEWIYSHDSPTKVLEDLIRKAKDNSEQVY